MNEIDQNFREDFNSIRVPLSFDPNASKRDQVLYALAQIGCGSSEDVIMELSRHNLVVDPVPYLEVFFDMGLIGGVKKGGVMYYDLGKMINPNNKDS